MHTQPDSTPTRKLPQPDPKQFAAVARPGLRCWCLLVGLSVLVVGNQLSAQEQRPGALLLKETDRVIVGKISRRGDFYDVELAADSRISIAAAKVAHMAGSREELYEFKCQSISRTGALSQSLWSVGDHFQLTRWCLVNDLLPQAATHYTQVVARNADHPRIKQLGVELQQRLLQDEPFRQHLGLPPLNSPNPNASVAERSIFATSSTGSPAAKTPLPGGKESPSTQEQMGSNPGKPERGSLFGGGTAQPISTAYSAGHPSETTPPVVSAAAHDLTAAIQNPQIAQRFFERVQPILTSRCSQAACHGGQSSRELRLLAHQGQPSSRVSAENLASALRQADAPPTVTSPLMRYALEPHGTQRTAAISISETRLIQELQDWVDSVRNPVVPAIASGQAGSGSAETSPADPAPTPNWVDMPGSGLNPVSPGEAPLRSVPQKSVPQNPLPQNPLPPENSLRSPVADPFDPAEFNRKTRNVHSD